VKTLLLVKLAFVPLLAFWIGAPYLFADARSAALAVGATQFLLGVAMAASVLLGRPWTALFSASQWSGVNREPLFLRINAIMSGLWAAMFLYLAGARILAAPPVAQNQVRGEGDGGRDAGQHREEGAAGRRREKRYERASAGQGSEADGDEARSEDKERRLRRRAQQLEVAQNDQRDWQQSQQIAALEPPVGDEAERPR